MHGDGRQQLERAPSAAVDRPRPLKWRIDRTTVAHVCKVAKQGALDALAANRPGRPGKTAAELALDDALADNARLRETIAEQVIELHLVRGKERWG